MAVKTAFDFVASLDHRWLVVKNVGENKLHEVVDEYNRRGMGGNTKLRVEIKEAQGDTMIRRQQICPYCGGK